MSTPDSGNSPIEIGSLDELIQREAEIVARINALPSGGRLFMADPIRLLGDLDVRLAANAKHELEVKLGEVQLATNPLRRLYDDFKRDGADPAMTIHVRGIVPKETHRNV